MSTAQADRPTKEIARIPIRRLSTLAMNLSVQRYRVQRRGAAPSAATRGYPAAPRTSEYTLDMQPLLGATALFFLVAAGEEPDRAGPLVECSSALKGHWTTVRNHRKQLAFVADARRAGELAEGLPVDCGLEIAAMCGEDLNGDGISEILVRAHWEDRFPETVDDLQPLAENERCHRKHYGVVRTRTRLSTWSRARSAFLQARSFSSRMRLARKRRTERCDVPQPGGGDLRCVLCWSIWSPTRAWSGAWSESFHSGASRR